MHNHFLKDGATLRPVDPASLVIIDSLPAATYNVSADERGYFLKQMEGFTLPTKLYGDTIKNANRIFDTFQSRDSSTGVLLTGEKGSGKTMLAKQLAVMGQKNDLPTLVINSPLYGDNFNRFVQSIEQPCVILFDEFEKIYDRADQAKMLTLLDGTFSSKKLFVLTCNDKWRIDSYMRNRPGRIFYSIDFRGLEEGFVREYCADNLANAANADGVVRICTMFSEFNFDMLKALVEEMNRYNETAGDAMRILNVRPENEENVNYSVAVHYKGRSFGHDTTSRHPLTNTEGYWIHTSIPEEDHAFFPPGTLDSDGDISVQANPALFEGIDAMTGTYVFGSTQNPAIKVVFTRITKPVLVHAW